MIGTVLCSVGLHKGTVKSIGDGWVAFHCTRCDKLVDPAPPEKTAALHVEEAQKCEENGEHDDAEWHRKRAQELITES